MANLLSNKFRLIAQKVRMISSGSCKIDDHSHLIFCRSLIFIQSSILKGSIAVRTVTTLKETILSQVPDKQVSLAKLKKEHGDVV